MYSTITFYIPSVLTQKIVSNLLQGNAKPTAISGLYLFNLCSVQWISL